MKKIQYIVPLAAIMMGASASAALIASESFSTGNGSDYVNAQNFNSASNSNVLTGTTGFADTAGKAWVNGTSLVVPRNFTSLTHTLVQGTPVTGLATVIPGGNGVARNSNRELASAPSGSSFYISGLVRIGGLANIDPDESASMGLIGNIAVNTWDTDTGIHLGLTKDGLGDVYLAAFAAGNTYTLGSKLTSTQATETQMIVLKLDVDTSGNNDTLTAWVAQQGATDLTQVLSVSDINTGTTADLGRFVIQSMGGPDAVTAGGTRMDEFRFGTTMSDVTSIPEPATLSLLGIAAGGLLVSRGLLR